MKFSMGERVKNIDNDLIGKIVDAWGNNLLYEVMYDVDDMASTVHEGLLVSLEYNSDELASELKQIKEQLAETNRRLDLLMKGDRGWINDK